MEIEMEDRILIAYATIHGSTREIAEDIASTLAHDAIAVDILPIRKVKTLDGYSAVILGAPLFMFHLHKDALNFLSKHRRIFEAGLPLAVFAGGPMGKGDEEEWKVIREQFEKEMAKFPWLKPVSTHLVGGKFDPLHLKFPWNLIPAMKQMPAVDYRDWPAIQSWARSLPALFEANSVTARIAA
jgi:menaquinone-dependent protoporphyrinogen oxidase